MGGHDLGVFKRTVRMLLMGGGFVNGSYNFVDGIELYVDIIKQEVCEDVIGE
jgi:hypothetical protein